MSMKPGIEVFQQDRTLERRACRQRRFNGLLIKARSAGVSLKNPGSTTAVRKTPKLRADGD